MMDVDKSVLFSHEWRICTMFVGSNNFFRQIELQCLLSLQHMNFETWFSLC